MFRGLVLGGEWNMGPLSSSVDSTGEYIAECAAGGGAWLEERDAGAMTWNGLSPPLLLLAPFAS